MDTFLVLGSNSFIAANCIKHLLATQLRVIAVSRNQEKSPIFLEYKDHSNKNVEFYQLDINQDLQQILTLVKKYQTKVIINFSAESMVPQSWHNPEDWYETNTVSTIKLHDKLRLCDFLEKYIHFSTPEVYGTTQGKILENDYYKPSTPYAVSRAAADMSLKTFIDHHQFPAIITRAANIYGPGQQLYRIIPKTIMSLLANKKIPLEGDGNSVRSFLYADDLSRATLDIIEKGVIGETYHISNNHPDDHLISIYNLIKTICDYLGKNIDESIEYLPPRLGLDSCYHLDCTKLEKLSQWRAQIRLTEGIEQVSHWIHKNYHELINAPETYVHRHRAVECEIL